MSTRFYSYDDKIKCLAREIAMRRNMYARRVSEGRMKQETADWELGCMEQIIEDIKKLAGRSA
jgi:hypothetical protein